MCCSLPAPPLSPLRLSPLSASLPSSPPSPLSAPHFLQAYESGVVANTEEAMGEYVKALVRLDALDGSRLAATLQRGAESSFAARGLASAGNYMPPPAAASQAGSNLPWYAQGPQFGGGGGGGGLSGVAAAALAAAGVSNANSSGGGDLGSQRNPLVITQAEPSLMAQVRECWCRQVAHRENTWQCKQTARTV
jgi:hypothetical protein